MPRFVILEHNHPFLHWDFMLESGDVLRTWRLSALPEPGPTVRAELLGDHRKLYLDYEGPVSNDRGTVKRWEAGTLEWKVDEADHVVVELCGQRWRGSVRLRRNPDGAWAATFHAAQAVD
jgi:hypothetical protein